MSAVSLYIRKELEYLAELKKTVAKVKKELLDELNKIAVDELMLQAAVHRMAAQDQGETETVGTSGDGMPEDKPVDPDQPDEEGLQLDVDKALEIYDGTFGDGSTFDDSKPEDERM